MEKYDGLVLYVFDSPLYSFTVQRWKANEQFLYFSLLPSPSVAAVPLGSVFVVEK
jgi:hypothetical protein